MAPTGALLTTASPLVATSAVPAAQRPASRAGRFWASTIGKKIVMAVSGLIMTGFLVTHMSANLLAFGGPTQINAYARALRAIPEILWIVRIILLASAVLHVVAAAQLSRRSTAARPQGYETRDPQVSTIASRTIGWGGVLLLLFIVVHLLHFTTGTLLPGFVHLDPYGNLVRGFSAQQGMAVFYILMMIVLGLHLYHGTWAALRTLGVSRPKRNPLVRPIATVLAVGLWLGFTAVPVGVLLGWIGPGPTAVLQPPAMTPSSPPLSSQ